MRKEKVLRIENFANLYLQIFTIGYPDEGESVITMLFDKSTPLLTIVTDCYCTTLCHAVKKILEKYGNPHIDAFVWTHPHEDHSLGIQDLLDANDPGRTTKIFLSDGVMALDEANVKYLLRKYNTRRKYNVEVVGVSDGVGRPMMSWTLSQAIFPIDLECQMVFLSPMSAIEMRRLQSHKTFNYNTFNVVYSLRINSCDYLFTGDLENQMVQFLDSDYLNNVKYLKIPHHGSDEPSKFLKVLRQNHVKLTDAVTTVKKTSKLPNQKVLNEYKKIAENVSSTSEGINAVGCVACIYKIQPFNANRHLVGNARMIN